MSRLWVIILVIYAIALTVATHWPRLDLGSGPVGAHAPDKVAHFAAFALLTIVLWQTRWFGSRWLVVIAALAWAALDELTQAISALERTASWEDLAASAMGMSTVGVWLWALKPVGGRLNRIRLARVQLASQRVLSNARSVAGIALGALTGGAIALVAVLGSRWLGGDMSLIDAFVFTVLIAAASGAHWSFIVLQRKAIARIGEEQACFNCDRPVTNLSCDAGGRGRCANCGAEFRLGQWLPGVLPSIAAPKKLVIGPVVLFVAMIAGGVGVFIGLVALTIDVPGVRRTLREINGLNELLLVADMAYLAIAVAVSTRWFRHKLARIYDAGDRVCLNCKHDLRATPAELGIGTCGECGTRFMTGRQ